MFYVKPLVRYYYYFYMSDHMNAFYNVISIIVKYVPLTVRRMVVPIYCHKSVKGLMRYFILKTKPLGKSGLNDVTDVMIIMHPIINFGGFGCCGNQHASLLLAGLSHRQTNGGRPAGIDAGGSLRLLQTVAKIVIWNLRFTKRKLL